jgi:fatty acid desaturase
MMSSRSALAREGRASLLTAPRVAWPTLALFSGAMLVWATGVGLGFTRRLPAPAAVALASLGAYAAFTPLHEAAHRSIARARWVSEVVGRLAAVPFLGAFPAVRYFHLEHHKHTNDGERDPDIWSGRGPRWMLPFRWLTQDLRYYALYACRFRARPTRERREVALTTAILAVFSLSLVLSGHGRDAFVYVVVPARLAVAFLAFAFDWLPHRPHHVAARVDRHAATGAMEGRFLYVALLGQSLHLVHHLFPGVPFYRYAPVWRSGLCRRER